MVAVARGGQGLAPLEPPRGLRAEFRRYIALIDRMVALNERGLRKAQGEGWSGFLAAARLWEKTCELQPRLGAARAELGLQRC